MKPWQGGILAAAALAAGYFGYGWPGVALAATVVAFWLLLQWSRALRAMQRAARRPLGQVDSAVMLHAKLRAGMTMLELLPLAGSLAQPVPGATESFCWRDAGGASVRVEFAGGRLQRWSLEREDAAAG